MTNLDDEKESQLDQIGERLAAIEAQLRHLSQLPVMSERISRLEENFLLVSDVYRYERLRDLLAAGNFNEADTETIRVILALSGYNDQESLSPNEIRQFPCHGLRTIDRLWTTYSEGRFGFGVQLRIYQNLGGDLDATIEQNNTLVERWGEQVGWRVDKKWLKCSELDYSLNAPVGCHPSRWWNSPYGSKMTNYFLSRLITCQV